MAKGNAKNTGSIFLTPGTDGNFVDKAGLISAKIVDDGTCVMKFGKDTEVLQPKSNDYGTYFIAQLGEKRYFVSERTNDKGTYMLLKVAPERDAGGGSTAQRPAAYGKR